MNKTKNTAPALSPTQIAALRAIVEGGATVGRNRRPALRGPATLAPAMLFTNGATYNLRTMDALLLAGMIERDGSTVTPTIAAHTVVAMLAA